MTHSLRKPLLAGNWKMNLGLAEAAALGKALRIGVCGQDGHISADVEVLVCPSFTALAVVGQVLQGSQIRLGAQNMHWEKSGAYTGEVSGAQLKDLGCRYVILGHSERRRLFGDTNEAVRRKLESALAQGLTPILCVGETLEEREEQRTFQVIKTQLDILKGFAPASLSALVIAYEPVWAIGTGRTAAPAQAQEVHRYIRGQLASMFDEGLAAAVRILYGGSVKADNVDALMAEPDLDGALVGGDSLKAEAFIRIVKFQSPAKKP